MRNRNFTKLPAYLLFMLCFLGCSILYAAGKPEIIRHDAQYLEQAVTISLKWQSTSPIVSVVVYAGKGQKELKLDEYDNKRNRDGYEGEATVVIPVVPSLFQDSVPYVVQIEDDLKQKSEQSTGNIPIFTGREQTRERADDSWGRERISGGAPLMQTGPASGSMIDKVVAAIDRYDSPPSVDNISINLYGSGNVSFSSTANDDKGLREITFKVLDRSGNMVQGQTLTNLGKIWKGTSQTFTLADGDYRVIAQAVDSAGNTSPERSDNFSISGSTIRVNPPFQPQQPTVVGGQPAAGTVIIVPYLDKGYRYKVVGSGEETGFEQAGFNDSNFADGDAGFGARQGSCSLNNPNYVKTEWPAGTDIILRKPFSVGAGTGSIKVNVAVNNDVQVFVNGVDISGGMRSHEGCAVRDGIVLNVPENVLAPGANLLGIRGRDRGGLSYIDLQITGTIFQ